MATAGGYLAEIIGYPYGDLRALWYDNRSLYVPDGWFVDIPTLVGSKTNTQPIDENTLGRAGYGAFEAGYGAIWYNQIHITPSVVSVGNLISDKVTVVEVWNGFFASKNFQSLVGVNAEGISITSTLTIPAIVKPLTSYLYNVTVTTIGPSIIDASYVWTVDGETHALGIVGNRVIVFPFISNWSSAPTENLAWLTSVERSYSGDEQRTRWRNAARKELEYEVFISDAQESAQLENLMFGWQSQSWAVPIVTDRSSLTQGVGVGATEIFLNTENLGFSAGISAILRTDSLTYEAAEIASVTSISLVLVRGITASWPAGTAVYPAGVAQMSASQPLTRLSDRYIRGSFAWRFEVNDGTANTPSAVAALTYQGQEVFLTKANWAETPTFTFQDAYETFGSNGSGLLEFDQTSNWPMILRRSRYDLKSRAEIGAFRKFLARRAGRWAPCWIPSWNDDFTVLSDSNIGATFLKVTSNNYRTYVEAHPARRNIAVFRYSSDVPLMLQIDSTQINLDGSINLVLTEGIDVALEVADIKRVCHMNLFRLASDQVTFTWETTSVASVVLIWQMVKE